MPSCCVRLVPDLLSTFPGNDAYELAEQSTNRLKQWRLVCDNRRTTTSAAQRVTSGSTATPGPSVSLLVPQDAQQLRVSLLQLLVSVCVWLYTAIDWCEMMEWLVKVLAKFHRVFRLDYATIWFLLCLLVLISSVENSTIQQKTRPSSGSATEGLFRYGCQYEFGGEEA